MRKILAIGVLSLALSVTAAGAESDGDHNVRPRPEFRGVQARALRTERVPVDATMAIKDATTVNFGFNVELYQFGVFEQHAEWGVYYGVPQGGE